MEQKNVRKNLIEWGIALGIFLLISIIFFMPVFQGKILIQGDMVNYKAMSKETLDYNDTHDDVALWTNSMFGGMPTFLIHLADNGNLFGYLNKAIGLYLPRPANYLFISCLTFFILLRSFKVRNWLAIFGAITFAIGTYMISFIEAGHNTKVHALAIMPLVLAGINYIFKGQLWLGFAIALLGMCLEIDANHIQITYYMFFVLGCWFVSELVIAIREKKIPAYARNIGLIALITLMAFIANFSRLYTTYIYSKETIRSGSELSTEQNTQFAADGLSKDYVFAWSYGIDESMTFLFPNFAGQASGKSFLEDPESNTMAYLQQLNARNPQKVQQLQQFTGKYWGELMIISGPVYLGAVVAFLFLIGAFIIKGRLRWWLIAASVLSIFLGWGHHFAAFNYFMYDYFPLYNKFRTVMMALVILCFTAPLLGFITLEKLLGDDQEYDLSTKLKGWKYALITVGVLSLFVLVPTLLFDPTSPQDQQLLSNYSNDPDITGLVNAVKTDRITMIRNDAFRTLFFVLAAAGLIWFYLQKKLKLVYAVFGIGLLAVIDLWAVNKIYLQEENYGSSDYYAQYFNSQMPKINDQDPNFRVFNTTRRLDQDGFTSWAYKSVGGYHAAKLRRYQDVIDGYLSKGAINLINMLNTKYVIVNQNGQLGVQQNPGACGNAWFIDSVVYTQNPDQEFAALEKLDPLRYAIVDEQFKNQIPTSLASDSSATIILTNYAPNEISYSVSSNSRQLAIFSEIFYRGNEDWKAYIDGEYVDHFRANYILRGLSIPEGQHEVTFKFEPDSYFTGRKISMAASSIFLLIIAGSLFMAWKKKEENA
jgi:hypothetical protein